MYCLGIEGTAHTLGIGITDENNVISNIIDMYRPLSGGIHPREAAEHHSSVIPDKLREACDSAGINLKEIGLVAFSRGPGLGPCLRATATAARALAIILNVPLVGVNHCISHLEAGRWKTGASDPVLLYASGGNTQVITYHKKRYRVIGETEDIGIGNMLDKFARDSGIPFPGGPQIEKLSSDGKYIFLPYSVKGMNVSFSGILTAAKELLKKGEALSDVCYSLQETAFSMLCEVTERAMAHTGKQEVLLGGGVVRNKRLRQMVEIMTCERGAKCFVPPDDLCVDNGAMIAYTGYLMHCAGMSIPIERSTIIPSFRTDEVDVLWRRD